MEHKTILVAALNWGLGHATRCIPIIDALQAKGVQVVLASDGAALALWRAHYPQLPWVELASYNIQYPSGNMIWNIARQIPQILKAIRAEKQQTAAIIQKYAIDAIISDNRYGLRAATVPSVFVGHQLHLILPYWVIPPMVNALHQRLIAAFDACWVPDRAGADNLAGKLAHPPLNNTQYLGTLSRFSAVAPLPPQWDILVVLSGPEPQRQYLEAALQEQLSTLPYKSLIVRGKPSSQQLKQIGPQLYQQDFMSQAALQATFAQSQWLITRSGYSTLLDLAALQVAPPLLIPTPGQTEQEYLAERLAQQGRCITQKQDQLDVKTGIAALSKLTPHPLTPPSISSLEQVLQQWLQSF